jgi:hypothetical protein
MACPLEKLMMAVSLARPTQRLHGNDSGKSSGAATDTGFPALVAGIHAFLAAP